ncbi:MAG: NfeD family protein [Spirochaetota bacterium]
MEAWIPVLLFGLGLAALFLELFIPALGIIGAAGVVGMIIGTVMAYRQYGSTLGTVFLAGVLVGTPALIIIGLKVFPRTFAGKLLILKESQDRQAGYTSYDTGKYKTLEGKQGAAVTALRPSGMVMIDGRKYSVVTSGELIEKDTPVKVIKVEGSRIVVRADENP